MGSSQERPRYAVIGVGAGIFNSHRQPLASSSIDVVAVSDINTTTGKQLADELGCGFYEDYRLLLHEVHPDVALILTPPFLHAQMAIDALDAGCHVLVEKPMAVQIAEADAMIEAATRNQRLLGVVFQHHFRPEVSAARKLLQDGLLGDIQRVDLVSTWPRPASYFQMASWRATWRGEGGGIITNQASHNLYVLCYLMGLPVRLYSWTRRLLHDIETEDTVHAMLEWANGALGYLHITTAEVDTPESIKLIGTAGSLELARNTLTVSTLDTDVREYKVQCSDPYGSPKVQPYPVFWKTDGETGMFAVHRGFYNAIVHGEKYASDGLVGRRELELANALIYSSHERCEVEFPLDPQRYASLLERLRQPPL